MPRYLLVCSDSALYLCAQMFHGAWPQDLRFVAITSAGIVACERANITYSTLDQYSSRDEIISLGWSNYDSLSSFCEHWDKLAQDLSPSLRSRDIKPFRFSYYDLKIVIDSISIKLLMLQNFVKHAAEGEVIYLPEFHQEIVDGELLRPCSYVNMFSVLLENSFSEDIKLTRLPLSKTSIMQNIWLTIARGFLLFIRNRIRFMRDVVRTKTNCRSVGNSYLCFSYGHDISYIVPQLVKEHLSLIHPPVALLTKVAPEFIDECEMLVQKIVLDDGFKDFFSQQDDNYFFFVKEALSDYLRVTLPRALSEYEYVREQLPKWKIKFSLTGTVNLGLVVRCRMLAAQAEGVPLISYQEGAGYGSIITPIYDYTEALDGDVMLCYGEGNCEYYAELGISAKKMVPVGSVHQEFVRKGLRKLPSPEQIRTIMYVGTVVEDNVMHCPNNGLVSTLFCSNQLKIFRLLNSLPEGIRLIAKPHPNDHISLELLQFSEFENIQIQTRHFEQVLQDVDLFILDFPSTVLLSCIATSAYVFVLAEEGMTGFTYKQKERLEKRAYLFEKFEGLAASVREITKDIASFPPRLDESYMMAYSLHKPDGNTAKRVVTALAEFV